MSESDILQVQLWLGAVALGFLWVAMTAAGWNHRYFIGAMFSVATALGLCAVFWQRIYPAIPTGVGSQIAEIASSPISWFTIFVLALVAVLLIRKSKARIEVGQQQVATARNETEPTAWTIVSLPDIDARDAFFQILERSTWRETQLRTTTDISNLVRDWLEVRLSDEIHKALVNSRLDSWGEEILPNGATAPERPIPADTWVKVEIAFDRLNVPRTAAHWRAGAGQTGRMAWVGIKFSREQIFRLFPIIPTTVPKRISLHEFIFVESPKVGWQRDGEDARKGFMTLITRLEQAAIDGEIHFFGKTQHDIDDRDQQPLVPIPDDHWREHQIDLIAAIFKSNSENFSRLRISSLETPVYFDLHLNRIEALRWLQSEGQP